MPIYKPTSVSPNAPLRVRPRTSTEAVGAEQEVKSYNDVKANFEIKGVLGQGQFGVVEKVIDLRNNRECALKRPKRHLDIEAECAMMEKLNSASGVAPQLYECGRDYILMELIKGAQLKTWVSAHSKKDIPKIFRTYADLIDAIHNAGVVHGDLNAGNIIVTPSGWTAVDFGFSSEDDNESWDTIAGVLVMIVNPILYPQVLDDPDLQKNIYNWCKNVGSTDDIRDIADTIEKALEPAEVEYESLTSSLRRLSESISGHHLEVRNNALVFPVDPPNVEAPEPGLKTRGEYHITIVSPPELSSAIKNGTWGSISAVAELAKDWKITGEPKYVCIGKQEKDDNAAYFIVVDWPEAQEFRKEQFFLGKKDLHITIGFRQSDIHDVPKDKTTCVRELTERTFQQELSLDIPESVIAVLKDIKKEGGKGVIIGGSVRDAILGKKAKDIDVEVYGLPGEKLSEILGRHGKVNLVGKQFGVYKTRLNGVAYDIDFSLPRREYKVSTGHKGFDVKPDPSMGYVDAAKRRDFTINTIGYDPLEKTVYDPHGGIEALKKGVIKMTDPNAFKDDPLRVLRMAQFASRFGFDVDPETLKHAKEAPELETLPSERILEEFKKALLRAKKPSIFLDQLEKAGTIDRIFPEIKGSLEDLKKNMDAAAAKRTGNEEEDFVLMLAAMVLNLPWNTALKFIERFVKETDVKDNVKDIYEAVKKAQAGFPATDSEIRRWLSTIKKSNIDILRRVMPIEFGSKADALFRKVDELLPSIEPIVMGRDLQALGVAPGPTMGRILKQLHQKQLDGEFKDLEGGKAIAKELMKTTTEADEVLSLPSLLRRVETFFEGNGGDVIVVDIDGTLMDVSARGTQSLKDIGIEATPENWDTLAKELKPPNRGKFFKGFLTDKYTNLDTPNASVFDFVKKISSETGIPVVILTGRSVAQKGSTTKVGELLTQQGVTVKDVIQKSGPESFIKSDAFKINAIKIKGYNPRYVLDDDDRNLSAFAKEWPEAKLYKVDAHGNIQEYSAPKKGPDNA